MADAFFQLANWMEAASAITVMVSEVAPMVSSSFPDLAGFICRYDDIALRVALKSRGVDAHRIGSRR